MAWETTKPIIVPIDFSGMSVDAIGTACQMAASRDQIHVVHVVAQLDQIVVGSKTSLPSDEDRRAAVCQHFSDFLSKHGFDGIREIILDGKPGTRISEYANEVHAGLVVISSHGYDGMKRLLLGSVAEDVTRLAECPVFILRRKDAE